MTDICFIDTETRSALNVTEVGAGRYARNCKVIIVTYAINDGPVQEWTVTSFDEELDWDDAPADLASFEGIFCAFNSGFDRQVMNHGIVGCAIPIERFYDAAVQGAASNLPQSLDRAARACGHEGKLDSGKRLINLFCDTAQSATPQSHPEDWAEFRLYARQDIEALRTVWKSTLPLSPDQWAEFWAAERINDRGLPVDTELAAKAAKLAELYAERTNDRVVEITNGELHSIRQYQAQPPWCWDRLAALPSVRDIMVKTYEETAEGGELIPTKLGMDRNRIVRMIAEMDRINETEGLSDAEYQVRQLLEEREFGASATPAKFGKIVDMSFDEGGWSWLPGQYVFNGAQQTGRYASRGVQMHNLSRSTLNTKDKPTAEADALNAIMAMQDEVTEADLERFGEAHGNVGKALSLLIRPTVTAPAGETVVWGDWSNIEARVLPWLAGPESRQAVTRLDIFFKADEDPKKNPDVYCLAASSIDKRPLDELWAAYLGGEGAAKKSRQKGKIAELSLGFGGGEGALLNMAAGYGMSFVGDEAKEIVKSWRGGNKWARRFWDALWTGFTSAFSNPGTPYPVGRVVFVGIAGYLGKVTVLCYLPDGRPLCYRDVSVGMRKVVWPDGTEEEKLQYTFAGAHGRKGLWYGTVAENITQGTAASILRATLRELEEHDQRIGGDFGWTRGHTHDEIVRTCSENDIGAAREHLHRHMVKRRDWMEGLPIAAEISHHWYYTKAVD